jgi:integrase
MATITTEFGKLSSNKTRTVYLKIRSGRTEKRINTHVKVSESEISPRTKKIKTFEKAMQVEKLRLDLETKISQMGIDALGVNVDAKRITSIIIKKEEEVDFFAFAKNWLAHTNIKGKKNYQCMLNTFSSFLGKESLSFSDITYTLLKEFESHLHQKPRAQSLYLGELRHLFREAMLEYNTEENTTIKSDPFIRYKVPKQVMKKGVRALTLEELMKVYHYQGRPGSRDQLARDTFILSFCLMGMNSVDLFSATNYKNGYIKYNRTKTKDRRSDEAYIEVKVHPFIMPLMRKYAGTKTIFNFCSRYNDYEGFNKNLNIGLKKVGNSVGIRDLEFYQARHTFATLSRNLMKFSKGDVDEALNHVGSFGIADIYIAKDFSIINDNNFKLIKKVFKKELA